jgi:hypothetical protein
MRKETPIHPSAERMYQALDTLAGTRGKSNVARLLNRSPQLIGQWEVRGISKQAAIELAERLGVRAEWIISGVGEMSATPTNAGMARGMSLFVVKDPPITIAWVDLMSERGAGLPPEFRTTAPDDALAPRLRAGQRVTLDTRETPRPGDCILVEDKAGGLHLRIYTPGVGAWTGEVINASGYKALESERDGLRVLAVLTEAAGRWG